MKKLGILEGLLFVQGDEGLTLEQICALMEVDKEEAKSLLIELKKNYEAEERGIRINYLGDAFKLTTKKEHKEYYQKLITNEKTNFLSDTALEVLAIVAYHQPITRAEIDEYRGISSNWVLRKLLAKGLIKEVGNSSMPGRPNLYGTTRDFLDYFGLATINDLPLLPLEKKQADEGELFNSIYKDDKASD